MRIGTMTWLYNGNYGTVLQAYALHKCLLSQNYDNILINYKPSTKTKIFNLIKSRNSLGLVIEKIKNARVRKLTGNAHALVQRDLNFKEFLSNIKLTEVYRSPDELKEVVGMFDIYVCGSDQIWSPILLNPLFYLSYVDDKYKKIAYAPSFGMSHIPDNKKDKIKELLLRFDHISIREKQGQKVIKELINKEVPVLLDPTLLLGKDSWDLIAKPNNIDEPYILCYFLSENKAYWETVRRLAALTNYRVVIVPVTAEAYKEDGVLQEEAGPAEWVGLIKNASLIITDSFHGSIFSILYYKDFFVFKRFSDEKSTSQNSRIYNLLDMFDLKERLIDSSTRIKIDDIPIDNYKNVHEKILCEREKSIKWIKNAIEK